MGLRTEDSVRIVSREEMRAIDRWAIETVGIPSIVLMENAGRGVAEAARDSLAVAGGGRVLILCGPGNNGGDGFVAARHLHNAGSEVIVACVGRPGDFERAGDAGTNLRIVRRLGLPCVEAGSAAVVRDALAACACVVDALFGTGLTRPVGGLQRDVIEAVNGTARTVVAVDIPSGLDADTGEPLGAAVRATVTATMAFPKAGFFRGQGPASCGEVRTVDIGIPRDVPAWNGSRLVL